MVVGQLLGWPLKDGKVVDFTVVSIATYSYFDPFQERHIEEELINMRVNTPIEGYTNFIYKFPVTAFCLLFNYEASRTSRVEKGQIYVVDETFRISVDINVNKLPYIAVNFTGKDEIIIVTGMKLTMFRALESEQEARERMGLRDISNKFRPNKSNDRK